MRFPRLVPLEVEVYERQEALRQEAERNRLLRETLGTRESGLTRL